MDNEVTQQRRGVLIGEPTDAHPLDLLDVASSCMNTIYFLTDSPEQMEVKGSEMSTLLRVVTGYLDKAIQLFEDEYSVDKKNGEKVAVFPASIPAG